MRYSYEWMTSKRSPLLRVDRASLAARLLGCSKRSAGSNPHLASRKDRQDQSNMCCLRTSQLRVNSDFSRNTSDKDTNTGRSWLTGETHKNQLTCWSSHLISHDVGVNVEVFPGWPFKVKLLHNMLRALHLLACVRGFYYEGENSRLYVYYV